MLYYVYCDYGFIEENPSTALDAKFARRSAVLCSHAGQFFRGAASLPRVVPGPGDIRADLRDSEEYVSREDSPQNSSAAPAIGSPVRTGASVAYRPCPARRRSVTAHWSPRGEPIP